MRSMVVGVLWLVASSLALGQAGPPTAGPKGATAPDIPGVIKAGTSVEPIQEWDPTFGGEGPAPAPGGGVLVCHQDQNKVMRIDKAGTMTTYVEGTPRTNGLAFDSKGRLIGTGSTPPQILVLMPSRSVLAQGPPILQSSDLVIGRKDDIYFTDPLPRAVRREGAKLPEGASVGVYHLWPDGRLVKLTDQIAKPNGIQLSPDEKVLYVAGGEYVVAFDIQPDGSIRNARNFAKVDADGLAVDAAGRLYAAGMGIRVFSAKGDDLGTIPIPVKPANLTFGGVGDKRTLYVVARGHAYKIAMLSEGPKGRAK